MIIIFNKPYGVICQFSDNPPHKTLKDYITIPKVYPAGRLDLDSEGLLILTNNGKLQNLITDPKFNKYKTYWVQVEGIATEEQVKLLSEGIIIENYHTKPAKVKIITEPESLWQRDPPIRFRQNKPTTWLELSICEGKNRQVRKMTAKVGLPTLRLIRYAIEGINLSKLAIGEYQIINSNDFEQKFLKRQLNV